MSIEGARRVMETTSPEVANQYLRFGWKLINQHTIPATLESPPAVQYVLASIRTLDDTREVIVLADADAVNEHLRLGWKLIDKFVTTEADSARQEKIHFVLAWQGDFKPARPGDVATAGSPATGDEEEIELDDSRVELEE